MRFPLFLLLVLGSLWACQFQNSAEKPSVSEEKMARINETVRRWEDKAARNNAQSKSR